jgi:DNA-binding beta-propeller fold protein YncE
MLRLRVTTLAVLVAAGGCASGPMPSAPASKGFRQTTYARSPLTGAANELLYVASSYPSAVLIYDAQAKSSSPIGTISKGISVPEGLAVDGQQNLYVANNGNSSVSAYKRGRTKPFETLKNGIITPIDVAVDTDGTLYVACANSSASAYVVQVFPPNGSKPSETLTNAAFTYISTVAVDGQHNLYVAASPSGSGFGPYEVLRFKAGSDRGKNMRLQLKNGSVNDVVFGLATDSLGRLAVSGILSNGSAGFVDTFPKASRTPSITINPEIGATRIAFSTNGKSIYVGDFATSGASVPELKYPSGKLIYTFTSSDEMLAVAISPAAPF